MSIWRLLANDPRLSPDIATQFAGLTGTEPSAAEKVPAFDAERRAEIMQRHRDDERLDQWRRDNCDFGSDE